MVEHTELCQVGGRLKDAACGALVLEYNGIASVAMTTYHDGMLLIAGFAGAMSSSGIRKLSKKCFAGSKRLSLSRAVISELEELTAVDAGNFVPVIIKQNGKPKYYLFPITQFNFLEYAFWLQTRRTMMSHTGRMSEIELDSGRNDISAINTTEIPVKKSRFIMSGHAADLSAAGLEQNKCWHGVREDIKQGKGSLLGVPWRGGQLYQFCDYVYFGATGKNEIIFASGRECVFC